MHDYGGPHLQFSKVLAVSQSSFPSCATIRSTEHASTCHAMSVGVDAADDSDNAADADAADGDVGSWLLDLPGLEPGRPAGLLAEGSALLDGDGGDGVQEEEGEGGSGVTRHTQAAAGSQKQADEAAQAQRDREHLKCVGLG